MANTHKYLLRWLELLGSLQETRDLFGGERGAPLEEAADYLAFLTYFFHRFSINIHIEILPIFSFLLKAIAQYESSV